MSVDDVPNSKRDAIEAQYNSLNERTQNHLLRQAELSVAEVERDLQVRETQLRKEAADDRAAILTAVRATAPDISTKLAEKMDQLSIAGHEFTERDQATLMHLANLQLGDTQDFFDLNFAQRDDLLDRVGFYRGISIAPFSSNQVQVGFRDVLRRPGFAEVPAVGASVDNVDVAKPFYRKPAFAGYFDNYFTLSEAVHQNQKNGVTNLKFSLAASAGIGVRGGIGLGAAYNEQSQLSQGAVKKKIFITTNFFLPRIELSFDDRKPCASVEFIEACQEVVDGNDTIEDRFHNLRRVLEAFGHFVSTMTLVGGRLFATEIKEYDGSETTSDVTTGFAAEVKANLKSVSANVEMEGSAKKVSQDQSQHRSKNENQSSTFHAMGGEGGLVQNAAEWIRSLSDYRRWSAVQRENLIPSLNILPHELKSRCWKILFDFVSGRSKQDLLFIDNASFIFYGEYGEKLTHLATETWFTIQNDADSSAATVSETPPADGTDIGLTDLVPAHTQVWRMTPEGHLIAFVSRPAGLRGTGSVAEFAMTLEGEDVTGDESEISVSLRPVGLSEHQIWAYSGAGTFTSLTLPNNYVLATNKSGKLIARARARARDKTEIWNLTEINPSDIRHSPESGPSLGPTIEVFKLRARNSSMVLSIYDAEVDVLSDLREGVPLVMMPDIGGRHQAWEITREGKIISCMESDQGEGKCALLLTSAENGELIVTPENMGGQRHWTLTNDGYLKPKNQPNKAAAAGSSENATNQGYDVKLAEQSNVGRQRWMQERKTGYEFSRLLNILPKADGVHGHKFYAFSSIPIPIDGRIRGMRFAGYERAWGRDGWGIRCELQIERTGSGRLEWVGVTKQPSEDDPEESAYIWSDKDPGNCYLQPSLLYLPSQTISDLRFAFIPGTKILAPMYRCAGRPDWIFSQAKPRHFRRNADNLIVRKDEAVAKEDQDVIALGLGWDDQRNILSPRLLANLKN